MLTMTVDMSLKILVIILSTTLAVFLIIGIVAIIKFVQILNYIKSIVKKADEIADKAENIAELFERSAAPVAMGRFLSNMADIVFKAKARRGKKDGKS